MEIEKILNWNDAELAQQGRQAAEQLFRLRFQMRMGQTEGVQKLRGLRKGIARIKTVQRQRELGITTAQDGAASAAAAKPARAAKPAKAAKPAAAKTAKTAKAAAPKKAASARKNTSSAKAKPAAAKKSAGARKTPSAKKGSR